MLKQIAKGDFDFGASALDWRVCNEVLNGNCYPFVPMTGEVKLIVDVGAHMGAAMALFGMRYPVARLVGFEPHPKNFEILKKNVSQFGKRAEIHPMALADHEGFVGLYEGHQATACSSFNRSGTTSDKLIVADMRDACVFLSELKAGRPDILKIDTEGCEVDILDSLREATFLNEIGMVYLEFHSAEDRLEIDELLKEAFLICYGKIEGSDRGQLCYVNRSRLPETAREFRIQRKG